MSASGKKVRAFSQSATQKARMQVSLLSIGSIYRAMIVPTLCVVMPPVTLCVTLLGTQSAPGCIPTQSVGTINH
jgi:pilus assembly protein TadC